MYTHSALRHLCAHRSCTGHTHQCLTRSLSCPSPHTTHPHTGTTFIPRMLSVSHPYGNPYPPHTVPHSSPLQWKGFTGFSSISLSLGCFWPVVRPGCSPHAWGGEREREKEERGERGREGEGGSDPCLTQTVVPVRISPRDSEPPDPGAFQRPGSECCLLHLSFWGTLRV